MQVLLLEQNTIKKEREDKKVTELEFGAGNHKKHKVKAIWNSFVYANKVEGFLLGLYYLIV